MQTAPDNVIMQPGLFNNHDDLAIVRLNGKYRHIPIWLYVQMHNPGGIMQVIIDSGLREYRSMPCEIEALMNIEESSEALWRYLRRSGDRHYYNILGDIERAVLKAEQLVMSKDPHLRGTAKFERMAHYMRHIGHFSVIQVKGFIEDATQELVRDMRMRKIRNLQTMLLTLKRLDESADWDEYANELEAA